MSLGRGRMMWWPSRVLLGLAALRELVSDARPYLLWSSFTPRVPERVLDHDDDMFAAIRQKDMLLRHHYETFDMVIRFLKQAAAAPNVVAIKQTLIGHRRTLRWSRRSARRAKMRNRSRPWWNSTRGSMRQPIFANLGGSNGRVRMWSMGS